MKKRGKRGSEEAGKREMRAAEAEVIGNSRFRDIEGSRAEGRPNIFIGTLNVIAGPARQLLNPVKRVCYPPLLEHFEERYRKPFARHASTWLIIDLVLLFICGALVAGLLIVYMVLPAVTRQDYVTVALLQPQSVVSGRETALIFSYANGSDKNIAGVGLTVELPEGFVASDAPATDAAGKEIMFAADPDFPQRLTFSLGTLAASGRGEVRVPGRLYGATGETMPVYAGLSYWKEGRAEPEKDAVYYELPIADSVIALDLEAETPFMRGTSNRVRIIYTNESGEPVDDLTIRFVPPTGFRLTGSVPQYRAGVPEWRVGTLGAGEGGAIDVFGSLGAKDVPTFAVEALVPGAAGLATIESVSENADAIATGFEMSHSVLGTSGASFLYPGQEVQVEIRFANTGERAFRDVSLELQPSVRYLERAEETVVWNAEGSPELAEIAPGASGAVIATFKVVETVTEDMLGPDENPVVEFAASARYRLTDDAVRQFFSDSDVISLPIATVLTLETGSLYYSKTGDQLGVGPLPPRTGETTRLWAVVSVKNGANAVRNARLEAKLAPDAEWTGRTSITAGEPIAYLPTERRVIWNIGDIPAFSNGDGAGVNLSMEIGLTPGEEDVGSVPVLIESLKIVGEDTVTGAKVYAEGDPVTTGVRFGKWTQETGRIIE